MSRYVIFRLLYIIPTVVGVITVSFLLLRLIPGCPAEFILGEFATEAKLEALREDLGLADPIHIQYIKYVLEFFQGDLGVSIVTRRPVFYEIMRMLPFSLHLAGAGVAFSAIVGIPMGIISAIRQNTILDHSAMFVALIGVSMPPFWLGIMAILIFSYWVPIFPSIGLGDPASIMSLLYFLALPAAVLGLTQAAGVARLTRSSMLEVIRQDFIQTARSKGTSERVVVFRHVLRNAIIPVIAFLGVATGWAIGNAILIEAVFGRPGVGLLMIHAIYQRDYPVVQAGMAVLAICFVLINLMVDLIYGYFDPRIRYD